MFSKILSTVFMAAFATAQVADLGGVPGGVMASLNVTSLNNILQLAAPLSANKVLNGNTFAINYKKKGFLGVYNVDIQDISFITVDGFDVRDVSFKEGTDTLVATVGGIDVNATCNAEVSGLWVIGAALEAFTLKNITVQIELATTSDNQVNWQLSEVTRLSLEDLTLTLDSRFWQRLVNKNMNLIKIGIYTGLQKVVSIIDAKAAALNAKLAAGEDFFMAIHGSQMNTTMTTFPSLSREANLITINMDGRFVDEETGTARAAGPTSAPALVDGKQRDEIFIHQSVFNSLVFDQVKSFNGTNVTLEVLKAFPELASHYGADATAEIHFTHANQPAGDMDQITFSVEDGIQVGDAAKGGIITQMQILMSNGAVSSELAAEVSFGNVMNLNFTFDDFLLFKHYSAQQALNTAVTAGTGAVTVATDDEKMTAFLTALGNHYNEKHVDGINYKANQIVGFVAGLLRHTLLTPYVVDEYLYGGFSWISDGVW